MRVPAILVAALLTVASAETAAGQVNQPVNPNAAGILAFRNGTPWQVIVQVSIVLANGQQRHGQPHLINPGEAAWDQVVGVGPKFVTVYDPRTQKPVGQERINFTGRDLFFVIQLDPVAKGKVRLVPVSDPRTFPGIPGAAPGQPGAMPLPGVVPGTPGAVPGVPGYGFIPGNSSTPPRR